MSRKKGHNNTSLSGTEKDISEQLLTVKTRNKRYKTELPGGKFKRKNSMRFFICSSSRELCSKILEILTDYKSSKETGEVHRSQFLFVLNQLN